MPLLQPDCFHKPATHECWHIFYLSDHWYLSSQLRFVLEAAWPMVVQRSVPRCFNLKVGGYPPLNSGHLLCFTVLRFVCLPSWIWCALSFHFEWKQNWENNYSPRRWVLRDSFAFLPEWQVFRIASEMSDIACDYEATYKTYSGMK